MYTPHLLGTALLLLLLAAPPLVTPQAPGDADASCDRDDGDDITRVLLDTYHYNSLLPAPWSATGSWQEISNSSDGTCRPEVENVMCDSTFLLFTQLINTSSTSEFEVSVRIEFIDGNCVTETIRSTTISLGSFSTPSLSSNIDLESFVEVQNPALNDTRIPVISTEMGLYLRFGVIQSANVIINRVRVSYTICPARSGNLTIYDMESRSGQQLSGECVANANSASMPNAKCLYGNIFQVISNDCECNAGFEPDDPPTQCNECQEGFFKSSSGNSNCLPCPANSMNSGVGNTGCMCEQGYKRTDADSNDNTTSCSECATDHHMSVSDVCTACPTGSTSLGGLVDSCSCDAGVATSDNSVSTSSSPCDTCRADLYLRSGGGGGGCEGCPSGSSRTFQQVQDRCFCVDNSATSVNSPNTTMLACDGCVNDYFNDEGSCTSCPTNSNSMRYNDNICQCNMGSQLQDGSITTDNLACLSCSPDFFRFSDICIGCPGNSFRAAADDEDSICTCEDDYKRNDLTGPETPCLVIVGFQVNEVSISEGLVSHDLPLYISALVAADIVVPLNLISVMGPTRNAMIISNTISFLLGDSSLQKMAGVSFTDNDVALEDDTTFDISVLSAISFVLGGPTTTQGVFYTTVRFTIQDDDNVNVGFSIATVSFNESSTSSFITITRTNPIGSDLTLSITGGDTSLIEIERSFTFSASSSTTESKTIPFRIIDDTKNQPDRTVMLGLRYNMGRFNNSVIIGGGNHFAMIRVVIVDDDPIVNEPFPVNAIIGVSAAGAGVAVLLLLIVILCLCICRLRVNRQGFYPTYEDKTSEPPTMLRYSASLRSISSQTIVPVSEGRSIQKENEFYV